MRLGIDLRPFKAARSGIPVFAREIMAGIAEERPDWSVSGFSTRGWRDLDKTEFLPDVAKGSEAARARLTGLALSVPGISQARATIRRRRFETLEPPSIDLFYALNFLPPGDINRPVVPVVHDLHHLDSGSLVHPSRAAALARLGPVLARAPRIQAVSAFTGSMIERRFGIASARIDIVPNVLRSFLLGAPDRSLPATLGLKRDGWWLAVGMGERRKNLGFLLDVLQRQPDLCTPDHPLVLPGAPAWGRHGDARLTTMIATGLAILPGFVGDDLLHALYAGATALLMPSVHEGFGIPIIEAQAAGARVIASDNSAMPEVSGGHALHLPLDVGLWAEAMRQAMRDAPDPAARAAARAHAAMFTRERAAAAAILSLEAAI